MDFLFWCGNPIIDFASQFFYFTDNILNAADGGIKMFGHAVGESEVNRNRERNQ